MPFLEIKVYYIIRYKDNILFLKTNYIKPRFFYTTEGYR